MAQVTLDQDHNRLLPGAGPVLAKTQATSIEMSAPLLANLRLINAYHNEEHNDILYLLLIEDVIIAAWCCRSCMVLLILR